MPAADRNLAVIKLQERPDLKRIVHIMRQVMVLCNSAENIILVIDRINS